MRTATQKHLPGRWSGRISSAPLLLFCFEFNQNKPELDWLF
ncbi:hypothetical protein PSE_p0139 (plasmid) [Pseudovibrio sp. FO-BEG1]|nr:hypothetical protein PSE_p0139 [Pseudovibrio sp. FO-BEG1]